MSNFILNAVAQKEAEVAVEKMIKEYNDPELTEKGKKEVLEQAFFFNFLKAYKLGEEIKEAKDGSSS